MNTKLTTLFFVILMITTLHAQTSGTCGANLKWSLSYSDSTLIITGRGDMENWTSAAYVPWRSYTSKIKNISFPANITSIGDYAFAGCSKLASIVVPEKVTTIGNSAFSGCSRVKSVIIPENVYNIGRFAFLNSVTSVTLNSNKFISKDYETTSNNCKYIFGDQVQEYIFGPNIKSIGKYAFSRCTNVNEIVIPDNIQTIGLYAFENCSIKSVIIGTGITDCDAVFGKCSKLKTVEINSDKFFNRPNVNIASIFGTQVEKYIIGDSVTYLCKFDGCTQMNTLVIGKNVTKIVDIANCPALTSLTIPENVVSIGGRGTFKGDTNLRSIIWNAKRAVTVWNNSTSAPFYEIGSQIETFIIGDSVRIIPHWLCYEMSNITSISFPRNLWTIEDHAFYGCSGLTCPIIIPDSVTYLGEDAFWGCSGITSVDIGDGISIINESTFTECSNLTSITIGKNVSQIKESAFYGCEGLRSVVWNAINCNDFIKNRSPFYSVGKFDKDIKIAQTISSFTFGDEVQVIPAFLCYRMRLCNITIPSSVNRIGQEAFYYNNSAACAEWIVTFSGIVNDVGNHIFCDFWQNVPDKVYVPCGAVNYYKTKMPELSGIIQNPPSQYGLYLFTDISQGRIVKNIEPNVCDSVIKITAVPAEGYHFVQWNDGNSDNPRTIVLTKDTTFTAEFAINTYTLSVSCNAAQGQIEGISGIYEHGTEHVFKAIPNEGYHFTQWNDGNTDNPRTIVLTKDTTFTAEFAINTYIVQFFGFNSMLIDSQSVDHGANAVAPEAPQVEHYDFVGWDKDFSNVQSNLDVYAQYVKNTEAIDNIETTSIPCKVIENGQIFILRGDKTYTLTGAEVQ